MLEPTVLSAVGRRENNEDSAFASPRLAAVADGVGGAVAGELASRLAIDKIVLLDKRRLVSPLEREFAEAVVDANAVIAFASSCEPRYAGMATTLTAVALSNDGRFLVANIGDSRTYLFRAGALSRLTRDDSLVQELVDQGVIDERDARRHPQRSMVLQALDGGERRPPVLRSLRARLGDRLLLCSDGVTDYVDDAEISEILSMPRANRAVRRLVDLALANGSRDNLTVVVADVVPNRDPGVGWLDAVGLP